MTCENCKHWEKSTELEHWGMCEVKKFITHREDECEEYDKRKKFGELFEIAKGKEEVM